MKDLKQKTFQFSLMMLLMAIIIWGFGHWTPAVILAAVGASSLASTVFLVFALPNSGAAAPRRVLGGYTAGILFGMLGHYLAYSFFLHEFGLSEDWSRLWASCVVLGGTAAIMVFFRFEHPPAAGIPFGLVLQDWQYSTIIVIVLSILSIVAIKQLLKRWLVDLV